MYLMRSFLYMHLLSRLFICLPNDCGCDLLLTGIIRCAAVFTDAILLTSDSCFLLDSDDYSMVHTMYTSTLGNDNDREEDCRNQLSIDADLNDNIDHADSDLDDVVDPTPDTGNAADPSLVASKIHHRDAERTRTMSLITMGLFCARAVAGIGVIIRATTGADPIVGLYNAASGDVTSVAQVCQVCLRHMCDSIVVME